MYIKSVGIRDFRSFRGSEFRLPLGRRITCISGHNGVGKSTLLAILSNCGELKKKEGKHLNGSLFRGEYSDIIKHDPEHDTTGEKVYIEIEKSFPEEKLEVDRLSFRATAQSKNRKSKVKPDGQQDHSEDSQSKRYRLIPKKENGRDTVSKLRWPTHYLGLSRLYPAGEASDVKIQKPRFSSGLIKDFAFWYGEILGLEEEEVAPEVLTLSDVPKKKGAGVSTRDYGVLANSAGQDNVGQIVLTVLSFRQLKEEIGKDYNGGLLAIDELDATLHPAAQIKLFNFLQNKAKELDLQVVFTCHSLSLIEHIIRSNCLKDEANNRLLYLTRGRGRLEVNTNPSLEALSADLNSKMIDRSSGPEVPLIAEDDVARELLTYILGQCEKSFGLKPSKGSMSFQQIILLLNSYPEFFVNSLAVLDPDVNREESWKDATKLMQIPFQLMGDSKSNFVKRRVLVLPGDLPLERQYWELVRLKTAGDSFYSTSECRTYGVTYQTLVGNYRVEWERCSEDRQKLDFCKEWYRQLPDEIRRLIFGEWYSANKSEVEDFIRFFVEEYDEVLSNIKM